MFAYILKRLLLMIPTLFLILLVNFIVIQLAPGGPVEQSIQQIKNFQLQAGQQVGIYPNYRASIGLNDTMLKQIEAQYGFDQPMPTRFYLMLKQYVQLDFGHSFFKDKAVLDLIYEKLPVSLSLGFWSVLLIYAIALPLSILKTQKNASLFDQSSSIFLAVSYALPSFVFALMLLVFFAGGSYWQWFPLQGLLSEHFSELSLIDKIKDYFWHLTLPVLSLVLSGFASICYLSKYSFMDELAKPYVLTARAQGLNRHQVLYRHVFRNAILVVVAGLADVLIGVFFVGNVFIEIIFNLDGLALLGFEAIVQRDYPVIFGCLFIFSLLGLVLRLISDVLYKMIDPRINFDGRGVR